MAKDKGQSGSSTEDKLQKALQDAASKAAELTRSPVARSMLAAGLVTAAAALTANKKLRDNARKASRDAADGVEAAADNASRIGAAIVTAATDAVRKILGQTGDDAPAPRRAASARPAARKTTGSTRRSAKSPAQAAPSTRAKAASSASASKPGTSTAKTSQAAAPAPAKRAAPSAKRSGAKSGARGGASRKPGGKKKSGS